MQYCSTMDATSSFDWDDLRVALAVGRSGTHGAAARTLGIDPTTIGRRIAALEQALGARLFDRTPGGLVPTEEGRTLLLRAERVEAELLAAEREIKGADAKLTGSVRITAGDGLVHYVLIPALDALRRQHPAIEVELRADTKALDLSRREADVAIRLARPTEPALVARKLGAMEFALYASPRYLERFGTPRSAADLGSHALIGFDASLDHLPQVKWLLRTVHEPRWSVRATTTTAQVISCVEGLGIALLGTFVSTRETGLVSVLPSLRPRARDAWVVVHQDVRKSARVAAVLSWLDGSVAGRLA